MTSSRQVEFEDQLELLGIQDRDKTEVGRAEVAAVKANGYVLLQRREKLAEIGLGGE